jgi:non-ribosomal peptide synthetase component F
VDAKGTIRDSIDAADTATTDRADGPARKRPGLTVLEDVERRAPAVGGHRTRASTSEQSTLPELFQAQAERTPGAVAVVCGDIAMSYRELDAASNRLAGELRRRGVEPCSRVAVLLDRSPELVVALLAVLKSGSAYVPLDPAYPAGRLQYLFENSRPAALITRASLSGRVECEAIPVVAVDSQALLIAKQSAEPPAWAPSPADPAYVIYTSGSTGRPKGVAIHRAGQPPCADVRQPGLPSRIRWYRHHDLPSILRRWKAPRLKWR